MLSVSRLCSFEWQDDSGTGEGLEGSGRCLIKVLSRHLLTGTEVNHGGRDRVSSRFPTPAARVWSHVWLRGICGGQSDTGAGSLGFHCQFSFHQLLHTNRSSGAGTVGQIMAVVLNELCLTPPTQWKRGKSRSQFRIFCVPVEIRNQHL
jgi:hypothetical protein